MNSQMLSRCLRLVKDYLAEQKEDALLANEYEYMQEYRLEIAKVEYMQKVCEWIPPKTLTANDLPPEWTRMVADYMSLVIDQWLEHEDPLRRGMFDDDRKRLLEWSSERYQEHILGDAAAIANHRGMRRLHEQLGAFVFKGDATALQRDIGELYRNLGKLINGEPTDD